MLERIKRIVEFDLRVKIIIVNYAGVDLRARSPTPHLPAGEGLRLTSQAARGGLRSGHW